MLRPPLFSAFLLAAGMALAACSPAADDTANARSADETAASQGANGQVGSGDTPVISARTYTSGTISIAASGFFTINASPELNKPASLSDGGYTWIQFGDSGAQTPNATITIGEGEVGATIGQGPYTATGGSAECSPKIDVTAAAVVGHFSCTGITGYNNSDGSMGKVNFEIDFTASS